MDRVCVSDLVTVHHVLTHLLALPMSVEVVVLTTVTVGIAMGWVLELADHILLIGSCIARSHLVLLLEHHVINLMLLTTSIVLSRESGTAGDWLLMLVGVPLHLIVLDHIHRSSHPAVIIDKYPLIVNSLWVVHSAAMTWLTLPLDAFNTCNLVCIWSMADFWILRLQTLWITFETVSRLWNLLLSWRWHFLDGCETDCHLLSCPSARPTSLGLDATLSCLATWHFLDWAIQVAASLQVGLHHARVLHKQIS